MRLILWKAPIVREPEQAEALLEPWYENDDDSGFEVSADVAAVREKLRSRYPDAPTAEDGDDSCPWSDLPIQDNDRILELHIRWSANDAVVDYIGELAREHRLVLFDPQDPDVHLPDDPVE